MLRSECLEFEVVPERCLKNSSVEFHIGTPINQVITMLQLNTRILHGIKFTYSKKDPFRRDISIHLENNGIWLIFDARSQLLKIFSEPGAEATMDKVEESFGSTHPGAYDESEKVYIQSWRGLSFCFPTTNSNHVEVAPGFGPNLRSLKYDSNSAPTLTKMTIFKGTQLTKNSERLEVPQLAYSGQNRLILAEAVREKERITGMCFLFTTEDKVKMATRGGASNDYELVTLKRTVNFGDHVTRVLATLGAPSKVFYKSDDKMSIHKVGEGRAKETVEPQPHFFFNYFSMGFDILFDFSTKCVIKFVLHTNIPGHYHFGVYNRCEFRVACVSEGEETVLETASKYDDFSSILHSPQPVVISRQSTEDRNPFGATFAYGTRQVVVEVMDNFQIAALTIFAAA
ncbi:hypothetical protein PRIPAC_85742 [Pristionchus pacificus]|uniref:Uncharacterized protein n=1 Tax=Pristionchus pacificus TaxID=54126 RepID=A0A2A6CC35_PRIPA|nr:hypothetical protein PRIPAC_85742 [Pristionchus pacificus]|eukprot:PDM75785.1 hypothetical protein PRIPAC_40164 [Pristionchus pacificus]